MNEPLLDLDDAAGWLGVPREWLEAEVEAGRVSYTRIGRYVRFTQGHLNELVIAGERPAQGMAGRFDTSNLRPVGSRRKQRPSRSDG